MHFQEIEGEDSVDSRKQNLYIIKFNEMRAGSRSNSLTPTHIYTCI